LKDHTINFSSQPSTVSSPHRLYVVTGKGGVGKTSLSLAMVHHFKQMGIKAFYNSFDNPPDKELCQKLDIKSIHFSTDESARTYISRKLGSEMIASWIMKTPFFNSLFNMLPGLSSMILLGHLLKILDENPEYVLIIDSPSSGHAMTMFESTHNFKEMFGAGLIVDDIKQMHDMLYDQGFFKAIITTLPTEMAFQEGLELKKYLQELDFKDVDLVINDSLVGWAQSTAVSKNSLPSFLTQKLEQEEQILLPYQQDISLSIPTITSGDQETLILAISEILGKKSWPQ